MDKNLHILITNDDGVNAPGIKHLWNALKDIAKVTVIAPLTEQSATGLSVTLRSPLRIDQQIWGDDHIVYSVSGTPADCVKMGTSVIIGHKPDMIVSGINRGNNAGRNLLYSGTVAACIEGVLQGIPSIAFSCHDYIDPNYNEPVKHVAKIVDHVISNPLPAGTLLNVNFPSKKHKIQGCRMTKQGKEYFVGDPNERTHPTENHNYYWLGAKVAYFDEEEDCDITWLKKGYIAAVPIQVEQLTDHKHVEERKCLFDAL